MISYSAQFPVNERLDKRTFVDLVLDWNQGSKYDKFNELDWDSNSYTVQWIEGEKRLAIDEIASMGIVASQFKKEDEYGLWKTDFYPTYYPPFFVKKLIYRGYSGDDVNLPVKQEAFL